MPGSYLSQAVDAATNPGAAYDINAKYLLADKQVLAWILKYAIVEFGGMQISKIISCIGDDIQIGSMPTDSGLSNLGRVQGMSAEDSVPGEGMIFYDIRFNAYLMEREMKFLVNVEAQKSTDPAKLGYHLENRILFYLSRMISAQKQTEFFHSDFDSLKRVRSIWICMDSGPDGDSVREIGLCGKTVYGKPDSQYESDLMRAVIINIRNGKEVKNSGHALIAMLETLFAQTDVEDKKRILTQRYGMTMNVEMERRINLMCNLSEAIKAEGMKKGIEKGKKEERLAAVERMIRAGALKEQILSYGYTQEEYEKVENLLLIRS